MSGLFRFTDMAFQKIRDMGGGAGGKAKIEFGNCSTLDRRSGSMEPIRYKCVDKKYDPSKEGAAQFSHAVEAACIMRNHPDMKRYGPDVYHIDYFNMSMKMAYVESETLETIIVNNDLLDGTERSNAFLIFVFHLLEKLVQTLSNLKISHGDLHPGNLLIQRSSENELKVVDFDEMRKYHSDDTDFEEWVHDKQPDEMGKMLHPFIDTVKRDRDIIHVLESLLSFAREASVSKITRWFEKELVTARRYAR